MKKINLHGTDIQYHNPSFSTFEIEGEISYGTASIKEKRNVTICQTEIPLNGMGYTTTIGVAIRNPMDDGDNDRGKIIAEGRAIKNPLNVVTISSLKRLPRAIAEQQVTWAIKHVERNIDGFVNRIQEMLR